MSMVCGASRFLDITKTAAKAGFDLAPWSECNKRQGSTYCDYQVTSRSGVAPDAVNRQIRAFKFFLLGQAQAHGRLQRAINDKSRQ